jgi:hypothetical protein
MAPRRSPYAFVLFLIMTAPSSHVQAQTEPGADAQQTVFSITPVFQSWTVGETMKVSEFTTILSVYQPVGRSTGITLRASPAVTGGDLERLSGLTDMQLRLTHSLDDARVVLSLGVNIPTGKQELTDEEFATSLFLSNPALSWYAPGFGQGFNAQPGVVWAIPLSERFVVGIGATYHYKGGFTPVRGLDEFDPGDEISITAGFDVQLADATNLSMDALATIYGSDKLGSEEVFKAGQKLVINAQFSKALGANELSLFGRYKTRGKGEVGFAAGLVSEAEQTEPNQVDMVGSYSVFFSNRLKIRFGVDARIQSETPAAFSGALLFGVRVAPEVQFSRTLTGTPWVRYQAGTLKGDQSVSGLEAGFGLRVAF